MSYTHPFKLHSPTVQKGVKLNAKKYWKVLRVPHTHKKASKKTTTFSFCSLSIFSIWKTLPCFVAILKVKLLEIFWVIFLSLVYLLKSHTVIFIQKNVFFQFPFNLSAGQSQFVNLNTLIIYTISQNCEEVCQFATKTKDKKLHRTLKGLFRKILQTI